MYGRRYASHSSGITRIMAAEASAARAPQVHPVTILTASGDTYTGVAWVHGYPVSRATLHQTIATARAAYRDTGDFHVFTDEIILHNADGFAAALAFSDVKRISEVQ